MPQQAQQLRELVRAHLPQVLRELVRELPAVRPLYFLGTPASMRLVTRYDWRLPADLYDTPHALRLIDSFDRLAGIDGRGKVLWKLHDYDVVRDYWEVQVYARQRGFEIKYTEEFMEWLTATTLDYLQAQPNAGWHAQEASMLRQLSRTLTMGALLPKRAP